MKRSEVNMNCMSMQQEKKTYQQHNPAYQPNTSNTSRAGLRSCLRGEIEDTECKIELFVVSCLSNETLSYWLKENRSRGSGLSEFTSLNLFFPVDRLKPREIELKSSL